jgi:hypothetical protein
MKCTETAPSMDTTIYSVVDVEAALSRCKRSMGGRPHVDIELIDSLLSHMRLERHFTVFTHCLEPGVVAAVRRWSAPKETPSVTRQHRHEESANEHLEMAAVDASESAVEQQQMEWSRRAVASQAAAAQAFARLLTMAEQSQNGQGHRIALFIAATFDGDTFPFDPFDLRAVDVAISDDMLVCLDALRWGKADLHNLVPDGHARILRLCNAWNIKWSVSL